MFTLEYHHRLNGLRLEQMVPFERDVYIDMINQIDEDAREKERLEKLQIEAIRRQGGSENSIIQMPDQVARGRR